MTYLSMLLVIIILCNQPTRAQNTSNLFGEKRTNGHNILNTKIVEAISNIEFLGLSGKTIWSIGLHPSNVNIIYAGTSASGLYKSADRGATWSSSSSGISDDRIFHIIVNPTNPNILYVGSKPVFKSTNSGASWQRKDIGLPFTPVFSLAIYKGNQNILYAGTFRNKGVYTTTNGAENWSSANIMGDIPTGSEIHALAIHPTNSQIVFAGTEKGEIFKTTDSGAYWNKELDVAGQSSFIFDIKFDPSNTSTLYASSWGVGVYKSTNSGNSWFQVNNGLGNLSVAELDINSGKIYAGTENGIYISDNGGSSWTRFDDQGTFTSAGTIAFSNAEQNVFYVGTNSGIYRVTPTANTPPNPPTNLVVSQFDDWPDANTRLQLDWNDNSNNEDGFRIERRLGTTGSWSQIATVGVNSKSYTDTGLTRGTNYCYRVRAFNSSGNSSYSNVDCEETREIPDPPTDFRARLFANSTVLSWTDNSDNEDSFSIEKNGVAFYDEVGANITTYTDTVAPGTVIVSKRLTLNMRPGVTNSDAWKIRAEKTGPLGGSSPSTGGNAPEPPLECNAEAISANSIELTWEDGSPDEDWFEIWREEDPDGTYPDSVDTVPKRGGTGDIISYTDTGLLPGKTYYYLIEAYKDDESRGCTDAFIATQETSLTISLDQGWSWISFNLEPTDLKVATIFASTSHLKILINSCSGLFYIPGVIEDNLVDWNVLGMYKINVNAAAAVTATGRKVPYNTPILLNAGWNCIAYLPEVPISAETALNSIVSELEIAQQDND